MTYASNKELIDSCSFKYSKKSSEASPALAMLREDMTVLCFASHAECQVASCDNSDKSFITDSFYSLITALTIHQFQGIIQIRRNRTMFHGNKRVLDQMLSIFCIEVSLSKIDYLEQMYEISFSTSGKFGLGSSFNTSASALDARALCSAALCSAAAICASAFAVWAYSYFRLNRR